MFKKTLAFLGLAISLSSHAQTNYTVTDLGEFISAGSNARDINNSGYVTGSAYTGSTTHAHLWGDGWGSDLGSIGSGASYGSALNNNNVVVGGFNASNGYSHGFIWTSTSGMVEISSLGGSNWRASDINDSNVIAGYSSTTTGTQATVWHTPESPVDISDLGDGNSYANGINNSNQVVGRFQQGAATHAFVWSEVKGMQDITTTVNANGLDINDNGMAVGWAGDLLNQSQAFWWTEESGMQLLEGGRVASGVNNHGQIVGRMDSMDPLGHAVIWEGGVMYDLNDLLVGDTSTWAYLDHAHAINDFGAIIGTGIRADGQRHAYMLTPSLVPVPGAAWLFSSALLILAGRKRSNY